MATENARPDPLGFNFQPNSLFSGGATAASFGNPWKPSSFSWQGSTTNVKSEDPGTNRVPRFSFKSMEDLEFERHLALVPLDDHNLPGLVAPGTSMTNHGPRLEEVKTAPLFSAEVKQFIKKTQSGSLLKRADEEIYPQHGLMGLRLETYGGIEEESVPEKVPGKETDGLVYANITAPWSTFICGSQGSGKSHTLSCLLENALLTPSKTGNLQHPLAGIVFHYDKFTNFSSTQLCEAAYLCSAGVPVRVLVSPSNLVTMKRLYRDMPGLPAHAPKPQVVPMYFGEQHLNITMMKTLMAIGGEGQTPLYIEVVTQILREMAQRSQGAPGLNYRAFKQRLEDEKFTKDQNAPLRMRLQLLESFLSVSTKPSIANTSADIWAFKNGTLTIVDLSCPFVDENDACALFSICLSLFLERRSEGGRLIALDEAHKFLSTTSREAVGFTDTLLSVIRQQRHLATRVVIATQEPTLSPKLLDLCNVTIVHRFTSPAWYKMLESHLAAAMIGKQQLKKNCDTEHLFDQIVRLGTGEALVFCPTAVFDVLSAPSNSDEGRDRMDDQGSATINDHAVVFNKLANGLACMPSQFSSSSAPNASQIQELGGRYIRMKIRKRITADGGRSILAE